MRGLPHSSFIWAIENIFRVCIAWYKQETVSENLRQLCKQPTYATDITIIKEIKGDYLITSPFISFIVMQTRDKDLNPGRSYKALLG